MEFGQNVGINQISLIVPLKKNTTFIVCQNHTKKKAAAFI